MGPHSAQTGFGATGKVGLNCRAGASTVTVGADAAGRLSLLRRPALPRRQRLIGQTV